MARKRGWMCVPHISDAVPTLLILSTTPRSFPQYLAAILALRIPPDTHRPGPWLWVACSVFMALFEGDMPGGKTLGDVLKVMVKEGKEGREGGREGERSVSTYIPMHSLI